ncbi:hypothetical protein Tco_0190157 [Tanacetum coccineum]
MMTLADKSLLSGGDNKPPMLEKHLYDSWKSRMELYMMNRPHGRMILASVEKETIQADMTQDPGIPEAQSSTDVHYCTMLLYQAEWIYAYDSDCMNSPLPKLLSRQKLSHYGSDALAKGVIPPLLCARRITATGNTKKDKNFSQHQIGNVTISRVYYVEGLGHNLFSVGQFCDSNLEVAFRQHTCFIRNLEDFDEPTAMASEHSSSGPTLHEMTPATISSGLVPNPPPSTPFVPPSRTDWDILFQPLFDELLTPPPSVDLPAPEVIAPIDEVVAPVLAVSTGSPSSTTVDQDAPSPSNSQTTPETQPPVIPNDVEEDNHDIKVAHMGNDPYFGIPIPKVPSDQSSSNGIYSYNCAS